MADTPETTPDFCPYVGLQPFTAKDREFFFGREKEQRVISANLFAAPLTVLYGPSAVGKSSVLQAGVVPHLSGEPRTAVVYFATWQRDDYLARLKTECRRAIEAASGKKLEVDDALPLDDWINAAVAAFRGTLLLMLDQFEEYLLYHREDGERAFDAELARIVNRPEVSANVLIGLRDDSLSKLNRFSKRIPNLLSNTLQLRRLTPEAARRAITGPIERYNAHFPGRPARIDDELVKRVISDVQIENVAASVSGGIGGVQSSEDKGLIETAFLQLVLTELWSAAGASGGERTLTADTLDTLGGAKAIVRRHVDREVGKLTDAGREIAATLFLHLVTPSGAKYALRTEDLVALAAHPRDEVLQVLTSLANARLLRRIDPPERYEIFHDAFAVGLLNWRKEYLQARQEREAVLAAEIKRQAEMRAAASRRRRQLFMGALLVALALVAVYVYHEKRDKDQLAYNLEIAKAVAQKAVDATAAAEAAKAQALAEKQAGDDALAARELELASERARLNGDIARAEQLRAQQMAKQASAEQAKRDSERLAAQSTASLKKASASQTKIDDLASSARQKGYEVANPYAELPKPNAPTEYGGAPAPPTPAPPTPTPTPPGPAPANPAPEKQGNYKDTYRKGIEAMNQRRWKDAAAALQTTVQLNGKETGERINISGFGNIEPYVPHYYLGLALKNMNDCPGALKEFAISEQDGAIQKTDLYRALVRNRDACGKKY